MGNSRKSKAVFDILAKIVGTRLSERIANFYSRHYIYYIQLYLWVTKKKRSHIVKAIYFLPKYNTALKSYTVYF